MFKFATITIAALCFLATTQASVIQTQHVIHEPVLAKVGTVVHSAPSAVSHQSITQVHQGKTIIQPVLQPVLKTTVHHVAAPAVVHTYAAQPLVHHAVHTAPVLKTYISSPSVAYSSHY